MLIIFPNIIRAQQQLTSADVDDGRQWFGAVQQEISVRQFRRAIRQIVYVQMRIELNDYSFRRPLFFAPQLFINREKPQVIAGNPQ